MTLNMRDSHQRTVSLIGTKGKFVILYSPSREFIFGDGFCHNIRSPVQFQLHDPKILVPITPEISVLYARPRQYATEPRLFTFVLKPEEADVLNSAVQIYSRNCIFYRSEKPTIIPDYAGGEHMSYADINNPVDTLIHAIPGVINTSASKLGFIFIQPSQLLPRVFAAVARQICKLAADFLQCLGLSLHPVRS